jgi:hypothetical protein
MENRRGEWLKTSRPGKGSGELGIVKAQLLSEIRG